MKQKNLILVAVAVGCGLVAAFLTTQLSAGQKKQEDGVEIPVAAKDLAIGTKLSKDELKTVIKYKKFNRDALPAVYATSEEELADKRLTRTIREGEPFNPQDLTTNMAISPPPGYNMMSFSATAERTAAGFAGPGSKVDILASIPLRSQNKSVVLPLLVDMLVLTIDTNTAPPQGAQAFGNLSMVSLAVKTDQAAILHAAINRGADLRIILRNPDEPAKWDYIPTREEIWNILSDEVNKKGSIEGSPNGPDAEPGPKPESRPEMVKLPVPIVDLPAGTQLTQDVIDTKFKLVELAPPAPTAFVQSLREHTGKFLLKEVLADQFVPKAYLADQMPKTPEPVGPKPKDDQPKITPKIDPPVFHDVTVQTSSGVRKYRYQVLKNNEYKFLGEVKEDGTLRPVPQPRQPAAPSPDAEKQNDKKADRVIRI